MLIYFDEIKEVVCVNFEMWVEVVCYLKNGGCVGIFLGGIVLMVENCIVCLFDLVWCNFMVKMVVKFGVIVVLIYFDGYNSKLF